MNNTHIISTYYFLSFTDFINPTTLRTKTGMRITEKKITVMVLNLLKKSIFSVGSYETTSDIKEIIPIVLRIVSIENKTI